MPCSFFSVMAAGGSSDRLGHRGVAFSSVDVLVTPTMAVPPPTIEEAVRLGIELEMIRNTAPFNVYGLPTMSLPCGFTRSGMPIGMQLSGPRFGEAKVAHAYEQGTEWHAKRPTLSSV